MSEFQANLTKLLEDLDEQGERILSLALEAVDAFFDNDEEKAEGVIRTDKLVDQIDVRIERASIPLLSLGQTDPYAIRSVLTVVKVNNELERIADCAVNVAEASQAHVGDPPSSGTFEVMANSVIGMVRDANRSARDRDTDLARQVLEFDDTIDRFRAEVVRLVQTAVADGTMPLPDALELLNVNRALERIADHCTNICEQIIYLETGKIVRHLPSGWTTPESPEHD